MKFLTVPLLSLSFGLSSVLAGEAIYTFDTTIGEFTPGSDAGALPPVWSDVNGGSMMLEFNGGWTPKKATVDLVASTNFATVFQQAIANGGSISFDVIVRSDDILPGSTETPNRFPGWFEPMLVGNSQNIEDRPFGGDDGITAYYGNGQFPAGAIRVTTVTIPIEKAASAVDNDKLLQFNPNSSTFSLSFGLNTQGENATSSKYFIDNLKITSNATVVEVPPPVTTLEPAVAGFNIYSSGTGQYDRQTLRTLNPDQSWVGVATQANPVSYSITIQDYSNKAGMGTVFYLTPGASLPASMNYPDYGQPVVIAGYLNSNANGSGNLRLAYKNDVANTNGTDPSSLYGGGSPATLWPANPAWVAGDPRAPGTGMGGTLASVNGATMKGKWTITFTSNTLVTITSPSGETSSGELPNEATAQLFANPMYAYFGTVPGEPDRIGERVIFSEVAITGTPTPITGDIDANLSASLLEKSATVNDGLLQIITADTPYWFTWTVPATDFVLQQSTDLGSSVTWQNISLTGSLAQPGGRRLLLKSIDLLDPKKNFLRMYRPPLTPP